MFEMFGYYQGKLVFAALFFIGLCIWQSHYVNKDIDKINRESIPNPNRKLLENAPVFLPSIAVVLLLIVLFSPLSPSRSDDESSLEEQYDELSLMYDELSLKYDELSAAVEASYDDAVCLKGYFLGWEEAPRKEAEKSIRKLYDNLYPGEW